MSGVLDLNYGYDTSTGSFNKLRSANTNAQTTGGLAKIQRNILRGQTKRVEPFISEFNTKEVDLDFDYPKLLPGMEPHAKLEMTIPPNTISEGSPGNLTLAVELNSSTRLDEKDWELTVDVGTLLKSSIVAFTRKFVTDQYSLRFLTMIVGVVPLQLPVYKFGLSWRCKHVGIPDAGEDTFTCDASFVFVQMDQEMHWRAIMPD